MTPPPPDEVGAVATPGAGRPVALHHVVDAADHLPADAPVVVLGASLGSTLAMWEPQVAALSQRFRVVRYDARGHGASPLGDAAPGELTVADLAGDVLALLDSLGVARAHLVGLSLGGMTMMALAAAAPERVERLALLCTTARFDDLGPWRTRVERVRAEGTGAVAAGVVERWFTPVFAADPEHAAVIAAARGWVAATPDAGYTAACEAIIAMDLTGDLPAITAPTLVVSGRQDLATPPAMQAAIAAAVPGAVLELVDAAHLANVEQQEAVTAALLEHLGASASAGGAPAGAAARPSSGEDG